jgi:hypothetical protein
MVRKLPEFRGYTVDERLRQFRKVDRSSENPSIEFVEFDSEEGEKLLEEMEEE